ncbi:MAG: ECF transporter S component [Eubacterium sp.]|nr:ECF transporter S component [Eubacterium sp.]
MSKKDTDVFKRDSLTVKFMEKSAVRMALSIIIFTAFALALNFLRIKLPYYPNFITVDFSIFAELLATIAYGPLIGIAVSLLKNLLHIAITDNAFSADLVSFITSVVFLLIVGEYYSYKIYPHKKRKKRSGEGSNGGEKAKIHRRGTIIKGGLIALIPTLAIQFAMLNYYLFPTYDRKYGRMGFSADSVLAQYAECAAALAKKFPGAVGNFLLGLDKLWQYLLVFNIPATALKLILVSLIIALIYPVISPYLHFRKKAK